MNILIQNGPETPDPTQLDLFGIGAQETDPVQNSTVSGESSQPNDTMIRSPTATADQPERIQPDIGKIFELNHFQSTLASSLHNMSRELVRKSREKKQQELSQSTE